MSFAPESRLIASLDDLGSRVQGLENLVNNPKFREHTGSGFVGGLEEGLSGLRQALDLVIETRKAPFLLVERLSLRDHLEAIREDLQSFYGSSTEESVPCAAHIDGADAVARALEEENAFLREKNAALKEKLLLESRDEIGATHGA